MKRLPRRLRHGESATLVEHLDELRTRMIVSLLAVGAAVIVAYVFRDHLIHWLNQPLPPQRRKPITLSPAEPFLTSLKVSLYAGALMALPVLLWQLWSFLAPAFEEQSQRIVAVFVAISTALLLCGVAFGYWVVLPAAIHFLTDFDSNLYNIQIRASDYYSFATLVLFSVGIVFELPVFLLALVRLGVLTADKLRRNRRMGIVVMVALAVALPGIDPVTTIFESIPLILLYEGSIWLSIFFERRWRPSGAEAAASTGEPL